MRTGKRLPQRFSEIVVGFRRVPHAIFDTGSDGIPANRLVIRVQPDEGIKLWLMIKEPGPGGMRLQHVPLDMSFAKAFGDALARGLRAPADGRGARQRLAVHAARRGRGGLALHRSDPRGLGHTGEGPRPYAAGTWGPAASIALIERDGRTWNEEYE